MAEGIETGRAPAAALAQPAGGAWSYAGPIDPVALADRPLLSQAWQRRLIWAFLAIGLAARCLRFWLRFGLWEDECFLCVNFIDRGFLDLLKPLDCHQTAPVLFLWVELAVTRLLGFSELPLRLMPFVASLGGFVLFAHIARRLLSGAALVVAVAVMAVAYPGIRYAAEAKQYATDFFLATALIALVLEWWRSPRQAGWLWALAIVSPVAVAASYPCLFVAGGVAAFVGLAATAQRRWRCLLPLGLMAVAVAATFALLYIGSMRGQTAAEIEWMRVTWHRAFPPAIGHPLALARWLIVTHTGSMLAVPVGADNGGSSLTFLLCAAGLWALARRRQWGLVVLAVAPLGFQMAAAAMRRYPYGDHVKFTQPYLTMVCVLAGLGMAQVLALLGHRPPHGKRLLAGALVFLALLGIGAMARDIAMPYKALADQQARAFARQFWGGASAERPTLCAQRDLHLNLTPEMFHDLSWGAMYYCNQRIYRPLDSPAGAADANLAAQAGRPVRVAVYHVLAAPPAVSRLHFDEAALRTWLDSMQERFDLVSARAYPMERFKRWPWHELAALDYVEVYTFVPKVPDSSSNRVGT
jgi:hypothetical protein